LRVGSNFTTASILKMNKFQTCIIRRKPDRQRE